MSQKWLTGLGMVLLWSAALSGMSDLRLVEAVMRQDGDALRALLRQGVDVTVPMADGTTALHWAAHWNDVGTLDLLIRAGARVDAANGLGVTALLVASENGATEAAERLLAAGANPNLALATGETALMAASRIGSVPIVKALLAAGANVNAKETRRAQTALMWAAARRQPAVVQLLVEAGADVHVRSRVIQLVVNTGEPFNTRGRSGVDVPLTERDRVPEPVPTEVAQGGSSPLHFAARSDDVESLRILLAAGASIDERAADGASALVVAAHSGHARASAFLLEQGADANLATAGYTPLHAAVLRGDGELVRSLLAHRADPNAPITAPTASIRWSCNYTFPDNVVGATPFLLASRYAEPDMMRALLANGAHPALTLADGTTALMLAAGVGFGSGDRRQRPNDCADGPHDRDDKAAAAAALAVQAGADLDAANAEGDTALHGAAARGDVAIVRLLLEDGAGVHIKNQRGETPLRVARGGRRDNGEDAAGVLRKFGAKE